MKNNIRIIKTEKEHLTTKFHIATCDIIYISTEEKEKA